MVVGKNKIYRIVDVNFNRCKEGLRVIEDIFRYIIEDKSLREKAKKIRHKLDVVSRDPLIKDKMLKARNTRSDLGINIDGLEIKNKKKIEDIFFSNLQRVKESLRVLEDFFKILDRREIAFFKKMRYQVYELEKDAYKKWITLRDTR